MSNRLTPEQKADLFGEQVRAPKRALAFGGGGPAVGISIGFLLALEKWNQLQAQSSRTEHLVIDFPVWAAGCVGGWLSCLYHLEDSDHKAQAVRKKMSSFFREPEMYSMFPSPKTFTPDIPEILAAGLKFFVNQSNYKNLVVPDQIQKAYFEILNYYLTPSKWNSGDFAYLMLNSVFAPNPASRLIMSLLYKSEIPGLNKLWYGPEYSILKNFDLQTLKNIKTHLYINSYNIDQHRNDIYSNHLDWPDEHQRNPNIKAGVKEITMQALCASSALPYVMQPVKLDDELHMEGAAVDSFCMDAIYHLHSDLNEVWVSRIVDHSQLKAPKNLLDALNNLIMIYAGTTSKNDIQLFVDKIHREELLYALHQSRTGNNEYQPHLIEVIELPVWSKAEYYWTLDNLDACIQASEAACMEVIKNYATGLHRHAGVVTQRKLEARHLFR
jgi:hypothetical protein